MELEVNKRKGEIKPTQVHIEIWNLEVAREHGLTHRSLVVVGRDEQGQMTGFIPVKLTAEEIRGYDNSDGEVRTQYRQQFDEKLTEAAKKILEG